MSHIALARKWRPKTFSQLVGQDHITKALINAVDRQRTHHAYLFTGTRGVGKTSIARLLAKSLNCEANVTSEPCLKCNHCLAIEENRFFDLIEIDGASKTRVEDTRELLDNVQYAPTSGRYKIYLIDEVHMLSQHSFNALLKTLEEPPEHVKFLLATTDPQKLPVTVLSRCLQFNLKPLSIDIIFQQLSHILEAENIIFEKQAIHLLAKAADGSMRDALSLLDQAILISNEQITENTIKSMLGYTKEDYALLLLETLTEKDPHKLISVCRKISLEGSNYKYVLEEILSHLHQISIISLLSLHNQHIEMPKALVSLAEFIGPEDCQLFYQIALKGLDELSLAPTPAIGFEMTLLRMHTFQPAAPSKRPQLSCEEKTTSISSRPILEAKTPLTDTSVTDTSVADTSVADTSVADTSVADTSVADTSVADTPVADTPVTDTPVTDTPVTDTPVVDTSVTDTPVADTPVAKPPEAAAALMNKNKRLKPGADWHAMIDKMKLTGLARSAALHAELQEKTHQVIQLRVLHGHSSLFTSVVLARLESALSDYFNEPIKVKINLENQVSTTPAQLIEASEKKDKANAELSIKNDPVFQKIQATFNGELVKESIGSIDKDGL